jgi:hypothetical protein
MLFPCVGEGILDWGTCEKDWGRRRLERCGHVIVDLERHRVWARPTLAVHPHELIHDLQAPEAHRDCE